MLNDHDALGLRRDEKVSVFVEGQSFTASCKALGFEPDFQALRNLFERSTNRSSMHLYTSLLASAEDSEEDRYPSLGGYTVCTKTAREVIDAIGRRRVIGAGVQVEMATDLVLAASGENPDRIFLFSACADLDHPLKVLRDLGIKTTIVSSAADDPQNTVADLADQFIPLVDIAPRICRQFATS